MIIRIVAHEFYHARYSPPCFSAEQDAADEKVANEFGERVEKLMLEAKREKDMDAWRRRYRELSRDDGRRNK
jgi:hypothetical protein